MPLEPGISTIFFVNEGITPDKLARFATSTVRHVEVCWHFEHSNLTEPIVGATAAVLSDNGLVCHSLHAPVGRMCNPAAVTADEKTGTQETFKQCLDYLQVLAGGILVVHASAGLVREHERPDRLRHAIESLTWLAEECEKCGVAVAVENMHHRQLGATAAELDHIVGSVNSQRAGVCFDFAHAFVAEGIQQTLVNLHSRVITLHLCDNMKPDRESTCWPMAPHGLVDWKAAFGKLKNRGYDGVMMYEVYGSGQPDPENDDVARLETNYQELIRVFKQC